jgi:hypothetical protein
VLTEQFLVVGSVVDGKKQVFEMEQRDGVLKAGGIDASAACRIEETMSNTRQNSSNS